MSRGNAGHNIFFSDADRADFLARPAETKRRLPFELFAYCLMSNHFHAVLRVGAHSLSRIMQRWLNAYSRRFNIRRRRIGHLFQNRFKAILCDSNPYLLQVIRYVHLNPVAAGLAQEPSHWRWSGHRELLGLPGHGLVDADFPLSLFSTDKTRAREAYARFAAEGIKAGAGLARPEPPQTPSSSDATLRRRGPTEQTPEDEAIIEPAQGRVGDAGSRAEALLLRLAAVTAAEGGIGLELLRGPARLRGQAAARRRFARQAVSNGLRPADIAAFLGRSRSYVSHLMHARPDPE